MTSSASSAEDSLRKLLQSYTNKPKRGSLNAAELTTSLLAVSEEKRLPILKTKFRGGKTILHRSAMRGNIVLLGCLMSHVSPELQWEFLMMQDDDGETSLHSASMLGTADTVKYILDYTTPENRQASLMMKGDTGKTLLDCACNSGSVDTVKYILDSIALGNRQELLVMQDKYGVTSLHRASLSGSADTVKYILDYITPETRQEVLVMQRSNGEIPLSCAITAGSVDAVKCIIDYTAPENRQTLLMIQDKSGWTSLHCAIASRGSVDIIKCVLDYTTPEKKQELLMMKDEGGCTPLHRATMYGSADQVKYLLYSTASENRQELLMMDDNKQKTSLHWASSSGSPETIKYILDNIAPQNRQEFLKIQDSKGMTSLHYAAANTQHAEQTIRSLLQDLTPSHQKQLKDICDNKGLTALDIALTRGHQAEIDLLKDSQHLQSTSVENTSGSQAEWYRTSINMAPRSVVVTQARKILQGANLHNTQTRSNHNTQTAKLDKEKECLPQSENHSHILDNNYWLSDKDINLVLRQISHQWPDIRTQDCLLIQRHQCFEKAVEYGHGDYCQIMHMDKEHHWVAVTNVCGRGKVRLFDGLGLEPSFKIKQAISSIECTPSSMVRISQEPVQRQLGSADCGVFAAAFLIEVLTGGDPHKARYDQDLMRKHLVQCLSDKHWTPFPKTVKQVDRVMGRTMNVKVYCHCRMPHHSSQKHMENMWMVECGECHEWYHRQCIRLLPSDLDLLTNSISGYTCKCCKDNVTLSVRERTYWDGKALKTANSSSLNGNKGTTTHSTPSQQTKVSAGHQENEDNSQVSGLPINRRFCPPPAQSPLTFQLSVMNQQIDAHDLRPKSTRSNLSDFSSVSGVSSLLEDIQQSPVASQHSTSEHSQPSTALGSDHFPSYQPWIKSGFSTFAPAMQRLSITELPLSKLARQMSNLFLAMTSDDSIDAPIDQSDQLLSDQTSLQVSRPFFSEIAASDTSMPDASVASDSLQPRTDTSSASTPSFTIPLLPILHAASPAQQPPTTVTNGSLDQSCRSIPQLYPFYPVLSPTEHLQTTSSSSDLLCTPNSSSTLSSKTSKRTSVPSSTSVSKEAPILPLHHYPASTESYNAESTPTAAGTKRHAPVDRSMETEPDPTPLQVSKYTSEVEGETLKLRHNSGRYLFMFPSDGKVEDFTKDVNRITKADCSIKTSDGYTCIDNVALKALPLPFIVSIGNSETTVTSRTGQENAPIASTSSNSGEAAAVENPASRFGRMSNADQVVQFLTFVHEHVKNGKTINAALKISGKDRKTADRFRNIYYLHVTNHGRLNELSEEWKRGGRQGALPGLNEQARREVDWRLLEQLAGEGKATLFGGIKIGQS